MDKNSASYMLVKAFILMNGYTWKVEDVLREYKKYTKGFYVSYTMKHIIENNELAIKVLLGIES